MVTVLGEHRPVLVPRLVAVWERKLVKDHVLIYTALLRVEDCTYIPAAKKPRRECHSWREEFPSIQ